MTLLPPDGRAPPAWQRAGQWNVDAALTKGSAEGELQRGTIHGAADCPSYGARARMRGLYDVSA